MTCQQWLEFSNVCLKHPQTAAKASRAINFIQKGSCPVFISLKPEPVHSVLCWVLLSISRNNAFVFALTPHELISFQTKSMKRCPSLLSDTLQIVEDMKSLYIGQTSKKKLQIQVSVCYM